MKIRGIVAAAVLVGAAVVVGAVVLLWPTAKPAHQPTSDEIKASAQASLDASTLEGRKMRLAILNLGQTPSQELCDSMWNKKTKAERHGLLQGAWLAGCIYAPE
ncbi:hypothetical protein ACWD48_05885 [Streptomyces sp. NPDC002519]